MIYDNEKILIGLSGGINSMAVLCHLVESGARPKELHLFYAHFREHSPDTFQFVKDGIRYARNHFDVVKVRITRNSIIDFFRDQKMIPHPVNSPCSKHLKVIPIMVYCFENGIKYDLVGYVKNEIRKRGDRQRKLAVVDLFSAEKNYSISEYTDDWCFEIVDRNIGWHPAIYNIVNADGKRVFKHNNCLPCKNMAPDNFEAVRVHYPDNYRQAELLSAELGRYWGRSQKDFYLSFGGRELGQDSTCSACKW